MKCRYTQDELRSKLSKYANEHVAHIACSEESIYIRFKEGFGSTYGESYSQELYVTTIAEMKKACTKNSLICLADWTAQEAVDEITEEFVEEKELESAIADYQAEFEDTHPDLIYMKEKYNELSAEAKSKIECYSFEQGCGPRPVNQLKKMYVEFKEEWRNTYRSDIYEQPQQVLLLSFEELEQGKLIEATKPEHFQRVPKWSDAVTLGCDVAEDTIYQTAVYEDPRETVLIDSTIHRVQTVTQEVRVRSRESV